MMDPGNSHYECQKKQMPLEAPSVDFQLEGVQRANKSVIMMLFQIHYREYLTTPLKDATSPVHYFA